MNIFKIILSIICFAQVSFLFGAQAQKEDVPLRSILKRSTMKRADAMRDLLRDIERQLPVIVSQDFVSFQAANFPNSFLHFNADKFRLGDQTLVKHPEFANIVIFNVAALKRVIEQYENTPKFDMEKFNDCQRQAYHLRNSIREIRAKSNVYKQS